MPSQLCLLKKGISAVVPYGCLPTSSLSGPTVIAFWKHLSSFLLMRFIAALSLFIESGEYIYIYIYIWPRLKYILWHL